MDIGIFGLGQCGKTTIFSLLTGVSRENEVHRNESVHGIAKIYDERVIELSKIFNPKKTIFANLSFIDIPAFDLSLSSKEKNKIFQFIQNSDAILMILRGFSDDSVAWAEGTGNVLDQFELIKSEFLIRDIEVVENRISRLEENKKKKKPTKEEEREEELLRDISVAFESEKYISQMGLDGKDLKILGSLALFTAKPIIVVTNLDEDEFTDKNYPKRDELIEKIRGNGFSFIEICGKMEKEISNLDEEDKKMFMEDLGINETGIERLSKVVYEHIGLISFLTVGEDEVRAWTIEKNLTAKEAAGKIHSDLEKHFIKAEKIAYDDFMKYKNMSEAKKEGAVKIVGKDEIVYDGDILHIRANA
jgi:hypothetical protein